MRRTHIETPIAPSNDGLMEIFRLPPHKPMSGMTIIRDTNGLTLAIDARGKIWSPGLRSRRVYSGTSGVTVSTMNLLLALNVITQDQFDAHETAVKRQAEHATATWDLSDLRAMCQRYDIREPAALARAISKRIIKATP